MPNAPYAKKLFWTHAMVLLGEEAHVESWFCLFVSTKASRQSTLRYTHGSNLSVDGAQATNLMVTQDTDKIFIQIRPPCGRSTYVLRLVVLICVKIR